MHRLQKEEFTRYSYTILWALLAFQAGFLNAFGFIACGRYVSHVTGFGTQIGIAAGQQNLRFALELLGFPMAFIIGSWTNGILTSARLDQGKKPRYDIVMSLFPIAILFLIVLGRKGVFGRFGEELIDVRDFVLLFSLAFICGLQNGCTTTLTKGQIRTTHLTGISTDLGTDLARMMFGKLLPNEMILNKRSNLMRLATICAFTFGSILSVLETKRLEYTALWLPFFTSLVSLFSVYQIGIRLDQVNLKQTNVENREEISILSPNP